jgi:hypothetical protein
MNIHYLFAEFAEKPDQPLKEAYGIALSDEKETILLYCQHEEWFDLLKKLSREKKIIDREGNMIFPLVKKIKYYLMPKN